MKASADSVTALKELIFEIEEGRGPRFLLAVCDSDERADELRMSIDSHLKNIEREPVEVVAPVSAGNLVDAILTKTHSRTPGVIHLIQERNLPAETTNKFFAELNFQRDSLSRLEAPIILWLHGKQLSTLAARAPDFWSRRTGIFYFDSHPFAALLDRIFSEFPPTGDVKADEVSKALRDILSCERELQTCLTSRRHFSLPKADRFIEKLRSNLQALAAECAKGRKLDVVLWLWNASHMDALLGKHNAVDRVRAQSTLLERNDLLLSLAERIEKVLRQYSSQLKQKISEKQALSLVQTFEQYALSLWSQMVRNAKEQVENRRPVDLDTLPSIETAIDSSPEELFRQFVADQLEAWLLGETDKKPSMLSDEEAMVLKYLYMSKSAHPLPEPIPLSRIKELVPQLRTKVRLLLRGISFLL